MAKSSNPDKNIFDEAFARKIIALISLSAFAGLGLWMLLDPTGGEHSSIEKGSVYILKEIWSLEAGIIILALVIPFITMEVFKVINMRKHTWYRNESGYYLYLNKERTSGNHSIYQGNDLLIFHPDSRNVFRLKNYQKAKHNKFFNASPSKQFTCDKAYWQANDSGYYLFFDGKRLENMTSKYDGDDLYVKAQDVRRSFKLTNYRNSLDNVIREAEILN